MGDIKQRIILESVDNTTRGMRSAQNKLNAFDRTLKRVQTTMMGFVGISIATHIVTGLVRASDSAVELDAKLKLLTDSTEDFNYASEELLKISLESGSSLQANTILFTRMNKSIKSMGGTTQTTLDTTRALSQGLRISGASAQESSSVIRQWSQAMASGVLRGEEFNAVSENGARIIQALSEALDVSIGELRAMSKEGVLTAEVVTKALLSQSKTIAEENAKLPLTIGRAIENINSKLTKWFQGLSEKNSQLANAIDLIADNFNGIADTLVTLGAAGALFSLKYINDMIAVDGAVSKLIGTLVQHTNTILNGKAISKKAYLDRITNIALEDVALRKQLIVEEELLVQKEKEIIKQRELAIVKADIAVVDAKNTITLKQNALAEKVLMEQKLVNQIKFKKERIALGHLNLKYADDLAKLAILESRLINIRGKSATEISKIIELQSVLTAKVNSHTAAIEVNNAAQVHNLSVAERAALAKIALNDRILNGIHNTNRILVTQIGVIEKVKIAAVKAIGVIGVAISGVVGIIRGVASALFGWIGVFSYVAYEVITRFFLPVEILLAALKKAFDKTTATVKLFYQILSNPFNIESAFREYVTTIVKIDKVILSIR